MRAGNPSLTPERGFTYVMMLLAVALIGVLLAAAGTAYSDRTQRERERELLRVGSDFARAIGSYYRASPGTVRGYPMRLEDLLQDNRYATVTRHLRRLWVDPITGSAQWGLVRAPDGGIAGVYSLSERAPFATA